ncbi:MAG: hypothetical protein WCQ95_08295 [Bacteroidota bacterium]
MKTITNQIIFCAVLCMFYFFVSCSSEKQSNQKVYIISSSAKSNLSHFTVKPEQFYHKFNFIVDSSGALYYFSLRPENLEKKSIDLSQGLPVFKNLLPENIVQVSEPSIVDFLKNNILNDKKENITISIASQKDTIMSEGFSTMIKYLYDSTKNLDFQVRTTTLEENTVVNFKKKHEFYDPKLIKWDSSKMVIYTTPIIEYN